jgi:O-antigen ligase
VYIFITWILIRSLYSFKGININFIRDVAPYGYFIYLFPLRKLWTNIDRGQKKKIEKWLIKAFVFHFIWTSLAFFFPFILSYLPYINQSQGIKLFTIRPDFDAALMAITAYLAVMKFITTNNFINISIVLVCSIFIISQGSRSSFITFAVISIVFIIGKIRKSTSAEKSIITFLLSMIAIALMLNIVSDTKVGRKFISIVSVFSEQNGSSNNADGFGTANARIKSWNIVLSYMDADPAKQIFGVGFGPDFMTDSGALRALVASEEGSRALPRQPHNYALNTYARLGILGFTLYFLVFISLLRKSFENLDKNDIDVMVLASLMFIALVPISLLGVVSESPFGAISMIFSLSVVLEKLEYKRIDK